MIYFGGVTLGYFNLYPVGFHPKAGACSGKHQPAAARGPRARSARGLLAFAGPLRWPLHVFF